MRNWKFNHIDFSTYPSYPGDDLGVFFENGNINIRIWAPTAKKIELRLYENGKRGHFFYKEELNRSTLGTWTLTLKGDYEGKFYTFRVNDGEWLNESPDIYTRCVGINGIRGMIFDPLKTNPDGWDKDVLQRLKNDTDVVIYEAHVRDFSISDNSGIRSKGKYLGLCEEQTHSSKNQKTGIDHLEELGITHVHFLPFFDFHTVDEENPLKKYNWGYDPLHYNAPEGSYATDPYDGTNRIIELKRMIKSLHDKGIGVIMDVVYNHTGLVKGSVFNQFIPGYFYRQNPDGTFANASGCGSEIATERSMVRKYIIDSLKYWIEEFHIDGFRFDLMGIYDIQTMHKICRELKQIDSGLMLYGEGWAAAESPMNESNRAVKKNIHKLPGIAVYNDDLRDALSGHAQNKKSKGFISGLALREEAVKFGIVGAVFHPEIVYDYVETSRTAWANEPSQCINYVSCHDNYTLWDKLNLSVPDASNNEKRKMSMLAGAILLTSQGIPFLHSGMEFCRTKGGNGNSYKSPDSVNKIDWLRKNEYNEVYEYYRKLIQLRKNHPVFRMPKSKLIIENLSFCTQYKLGIIGYCLNGEAVNDSWGRIIVYFNGNKESIEQQIPEGNYLIIAKNHFINENGLEKIYTSEIMIPPISMLILAQEEVLEYS